MTKQKMCEQITINTYYSKAAMLMQMKQKSQRPFINSCVLLLLYCTFNLLLKYYK